MNYWLKHIAQHTHDLVHSPVAELSRWQKTARFIINLARHCQKKIAQDRTKQMAAALTYYTLFSLLPTIVLAMVVLTAFVGDEEREQFKDTVVQWSLREVFEPQPAQPTAISLETPDPEDPINSDPALQPANQTKQSQQQQLRETAISIANKIEQLMDSVSKISFGGIGVVGVLVFIYGATTLLTTIEQTFNSIFGVHRGRPWHIRFPLYFTVITLSPVLLITAQVIQARLFSVLKSGVLTGWLIAPIAIVTPFLMTWALLLIIYTLMPTAKVGTKYAAAGSFVAALAWILTKELFRLYVANAAVTNLYGALALLPLFLLWVYLSWLITLFGLEFAWSLRTVVARGHIPPDQHDDDQPLNIDSRWTIPLCVQLAHAFKAGKPLDSEQLAASSDLPGAAVEQLLRALRRAGLIHRLNEEDAEPRFTLAKPADQIRLAQAIRAAELLLNPETPGEPDPETQQRSAGWQAVEKLKQAEQQQADQTTLADLLNNSAPPTTDT